LNDIPNAHTLTDVGPAGVAVTAKRATLRADPENAQALAEMRLGIWARAVVAAHLSDRLERALRALAFERAVETTSTRLAEAAERSSNIQFLKAAWTRFVLPPMRGARPAPHEPEGGEAVAVDLAQLAHAAHYAARRHDPVFAMAIAQVRIATWARADARAFAHGLEAQTASFGFAPPDAVTLSPAKAIAQALAFAMHLRRQARCGEPSASAQFWWDFELTQAGAPAEQPETQELAPALAGRPDLGVLDAAFAADRLALQARYTTRARDAGRTEAFARQRLALWARTRARLGDARLSRALEALALEASVPDARALDAQAPDAPAEAAFWAGQVDLGAASVFAADSFALHVRNGVRARGAAQAEAFARQRLALWAQAQERRSQPALADALTRLDWQTWTEPLEDEVATVLAEADKRNWFDSMPDWAKRLIFPRLLRHRKEAAAEKRPAPAVRLKVPRMAEATAVELLHALRRTVRYGREDEYRRLTHEHGNTLASIARTAAALQRLEAGKASPVAERRPAKAPTCEAAFAEVASAFLAAIEASDVLTRMARNFPYAQAGLALASQAHAPRDLAPLSRATITRARRSLAWFSAGAPALSAGLARVEAVDLRVPRLICDDGRVFVPRASDPQDPAIIWLALLAHRCAKLRAPPGEAKARRAYRDAFIATFAPWAAIAEITRLARPGLKVEALAGAAWWSRPAPVSDAAGAAFVLQLHRGKEPLIKADELLELARFDLSAHRFADVRHRSLTLEVAIERSKAVITTSPTSALSCALRGVATLLVAEGHDSVRAPALAGLKVVSASKLAEALTHALELRCPTAPRSEIGRRVLR
jgi:hypothetical protein